MGSCSRCTNLNRLLADERKAHEETKGVLANKKMLLHDRTIRQKALDEIIEAAVDASAEIAQLVVEVEQRSANAERRARNVRASARRAANRGA